jgi:uncharacterized protein (TIGR02266 family)
MTDYAISRDSRRVPLETRVSLRFERFSGFISEYSANISPGGMFIKAQTPSPVGTLLEFEFELGDGFPLIKGTGEVVWIRSDDQGPKKPAGMGLRFLRLSKGSRELIYKIVDEYIHQGGEPFDLEAGHELGPAPEAAAPPPPAAMELPLAPAAEPQPVAAAEPAGPSEPVAEAIPKEPPRAAPAAPAPDAILASLSLPALAARSFGPLEQPAAPAPQPEPPAPFSSYATMAAPPRRRWSSGRLAVVGAVAVVIALVAAAFVFQEPLMRRTGLLGRGERMEADAGQTAAGSEAQGTEAPVPGAPSPAADVEAAAEPAAAADAIPEPPASTAGASGEPPAGAAAAGPPARPDGRQRAPAPSTPLTAIRSITWRVAGGDTELTVRGDGPIRAGGYTRARLEGSSPRELIRIRGVRRAYSPARLPVGSAQLKQVRTGHHVLAGGDELHLVLDLADSAVVVRRIDEVDGALVVRLGAKAFAPGSNER